MIIDEATDALILEDLNRGFCWVADEHGHGAGFATVRFRSRPEGASHTPTPTHSSRSRSGPANVSRRGSRAQSPCSATRSTPCHRPAGVGANTALQDAATLSGQLLAAARGEQSLPKRSPHTSASCCPAASTPLKTRSRWPTRCSPKSTDSPAGTPRGRQATRTDLGTSGDCASAACDGRGRRFEWVRPWGYAVVVVTSEAVPVASPAVRRRRWRAVLHWTHDEAALPQAAVVAQAHR
jgi:hypothetical protein